MDSQPRGSVGTKVAAESHVSQETPQTGGANDDGWLSDPDQCLTSQDAWWRSIEQNCHDSLLNSTLVEQARDIWLRDAKKKSDKLVQFLIDIFDSHTDVYSFLLRTLEATGKNRLQKHDLRRIIACEFLTWRETRGKLAPRCRPDQQQAALEILERCHHVLFDDICAVFDLCSANKEFLLSLVDSLISNYRHTEAVTYATKLGLQHDLDLQETLMPMLALDKINVIENYLQSSVALQKQFVQILDDLCHSSSKIDILKDQLRDQGILVSPLSEINDKLHPKQLEKLGLRLAKKFDVPIENYPNLFNKRVSESIHYILKKYKANFISEANFVELIQAAVKDRNHLQGQVIKELVCTGDLSLAAYFARMYHVKPSSLPPLLQQFMITKPHQNNALRMPAFWSTTNSVKKQHFHSLRLPVDAVFFVHDPASFCHCQSVLLIPGNVIGIDAEWRLPFCNDGVERVALLQLACWQSVFLLDIPKLMHTIPKPSLAYFARELFGSEKMLKLGYQIMGDLTLLSKTWTFAEDVLTHPRRVVDLKVFAPMVLDPLMPANSPLPLQDELTVNAAPSVPPPHPLLLQMMQNPANRLLSSPGQPVSSFPHSTPPPLSSFVSSAPSQPCTSVASPHPYPSLSSAQLQPQMSTSPIQPCSSHALPDLTHRSQVYPSFSGRFPSPSCQHSSSGESYQVQWQPPVSGLSLLVKRCLGRPLDKSSQFSDWEKRPLSADQIRYAALDAFSLIEVYEELKQRALRQYPPCVLEPTLDWVRDEEKKRKAIERQQKAAKQPKREKE